MVNTLIPVRLLRPLNLPRPGAALAGFYGLGEVCGLPADLAAKLVLEGAAEYMKVEKSAKTGDRLVLKAALANPDEVARTFDLIASSSDVDSDYDVIDVRGIDLARFNRNPVLLFQHDHEIVIGRVLELRVQGQKLVGKACILPPGVSAKADESWGAVKAGALRGISIGFVTREAYPRSGGRGHLITACELLEISVVSIPANPTALITSVTTAKANAPAIHVGRALPGVASKQAEIRRLRGQETPIERKQREIDELRVRGIRRKVVDKSANRKGE